MQIVIDIPDNDYEYIKLLHEGLTDYQTTLKLYRAIKNGTPLPKGNKCKWMHYDYRTVCPREHDINNPYWRIPENRMDALRYCPYCGKEIEIESDKED